MIGYHSTRSDSVRVEWQLAERTMTRIFPGGFSAGPGGVRNVRTTANSPATKARTRARTIR